MIEKVPNGLHELFEVFGNPMEPDFEEKYLKVFQFPYQLLYDGKPDLHGRCHALAVDNFVKAFQLIKDRGLTEQVQNYGGIWQMRSKRGMDHPSVHCWAVAVDLEPAKYPLGSTDRFSDEVVACFREAGFFYGGDFAHRLDPMHFQLCTGY